MSEATPGTPMAPLTQGMLDAPTFAALLDDLERCTTVLDVLVKGGQTLRTDGAPVQLRAAADMLQQGAVHGMQIRYRYQDAEWRDTLIWTPEGLRIVRMNMDDLPIDPPSA